MEVLTEASHTAKEPPPRADILLPPSPAITARDQSTPTSSIDEELDLDGPTCQVGTSETEGSRLYPLPPQPKAQKVLPEDVKTPDRHVERDPRLIRLTGIHPFNVEAPLSDLFDEGFLTTENLHYVRNHGPVPRVEGPDVLDWEFSIQGMVENPITVTLLDLLRDYEQVTYPITLVCAGNRRKEQNIVRKTKGFSWGAAGLSTALWTGITLPDLLGRAVPKRGARYVHFEGADRLPNGYYGTSIKLNWAMDENRGVLVAHKMNGRTLHPDHGKPLRIVIPGQIGGRSVKWLRKIIVADKPSENWYHIYDNRVLPTMISPEESADLPGTWKDERYAIYDLNTNSAIACPAHNETLPLADGPYRVRGYAYAGGGKRVTRVEVTLDRGKTWILAAINYPEDEYRLAPEGEMLYGGRLDMSWREACFCWCFWELDIPVSRLRDADDIMVRAMDESMMVQPRDMYWSVLGMMNNPWFRIVIHKDSHQVWFEHPTHPTLGSVGWMERVKKAGGNLTNGNWGETMNGEEERAVPEELVNEICMVNKDAKRVIGLDELKKHDNDAEPWFVVKGEVYNGTNFLDGHPGGAASIIGAAGQDATEEFVTIHSENAKAMMPEYHIGTLDRASQALLAADEAAGEPTMGAAAAEPRPSFLNPRAWTRATLMAKTQVSADTKIFTFALEHAGQAVGLPAGQHLLMRLRDPATREAVIRAYTPLSGPADHGALRVLVKIYQEGSNGDRRHGGRMTQALDALPPGHAVDFKGPVGKFTWHGGDGGRCTVGARERRVRRLVMVCAGSGVTPVFQVLRAVLAGSGATRCLVLDGNRAEEDILCRAELDAMARAHPARCRLLYSLTRPGPGWAGLRGRVDRRLLEEHVGPCSVVGGDEMVLICGPEGMERSVHGILSGLGWADEDMLIF